MPPVAKAERSDGDEIVVRGKLRAGRLVLTRASAAGKRINVVVDTGAELSIGNQALLHALRGRGLLKPLSRIHMKSVTGELLAGEVMAVKRLELGGVVVECLAIVFADAFTFRTLNLRDRPALLMVMNMSKAFERVSIDFANCKFRVEVPEETHLRTFRLAGPLIADTCAIKHLLTPELFCSAMFRSGRGAASFNPGGGE